MSDDTTPEAPKEKPKLDFIRQWVADDLAAGRHERLVTRFPPEPNGYLHIGHAKSICLNFGLAKESPGAVCHLRFDDTNPTREETEYVESIQEDVKWLGYDWEDDLYFASDYFEKLYGFAVKLIEDGKAFVCDQTAEEFMAQRGTPTEPGTPSPFRDRTVEESLDLFKRMREGEFEDGARTLRAKIDMASPNIHLRDPALYRIRKAKHHRTGKKWCIYPMYDFAHSLSDAIEGITHSLCTLEFEVHRPLYDWCVANTGPGHKPRQIEFARLNLSYTLLSKRKLLQLVKDQQVEGWDDPRMPTLSGLRRRGYSPESIRQFCQRIGVTKYDGTTDMALLEHTVREDLNRRAERRMAVLRPLKVVLINYPEGKVEELEAVNNPEDSEAGARYVPFTRELYIEQEDFMENPPKKFFRLRPGGEVRLRYAYIIKCENVVMDETGAVAELHCSVDLDTKSGSPNAGRKVKGTLHWVSAQDAVVAPVRLYDRLFNVEDPDDVPEGGSFVDHLNPDSLQVIAEAKLERSLAKAKPGDFYQFERLGYFVADPKDSKKGKPVFNRTATLRDGWTRKAGE